MAYINLNGRLTEATGPVLRSDNRAFRYGYGLFETLLVQDGAIMLKEYHFARLWKGLEVLKFDIPKLFTRILLEEQIIRTVLKNKLERLCRVRLQVFPGNGGLYDGDSFSLGYLVECFPLESHLLQLNETGLTVGIATGVVKAQDDLANLKTANALIYAIAGRQAKEQKWNDALIQNQDQHIIESTIANIFWVKEGKIYTPSLSEGCVAGVMRSYIMGRLAEKSIQVWQEPLKMDLLQEADEVFLTNAIRRIKWIKTIADNAYSCETAKFISGIIF